MIFLKNKEVESLKTSLDKLNDDKNTLISEVDKLKNINALYMSFGGTSLLYDGEKTPNELGTPYTFELDYNSIRMRSWEAYIKSPIIQTAIKNYCLWIVGTGLKFQSEPNTKYLKTRGIEFDSSEFTDNVECQFRLYANSKHSVYSKEMNMHVLASEALKNSILSGDCLIITRYNGYQPTVQVIDGYYVQTPMIGNAVASAKEMGNIIISGVEISELTGETVAYHVLKSDGINYERILSMPSGSKGKRQAWLMYGIRHKITDVRGMSLLTAVMERNAKLDRFVEASVGAAEENSKIPYTFVHDQFSTGENPLLNQAAQSIGVQKPVVNETATQLNGYASKIAQTTGKQIYNLPVGAKLVTNTTHSDPDFAKFLSPNAELIYATIGIPYEVALQKYNGSYSGSRAANKGWEYKMKVERVNTLTQYFYQPIYEFWFIINMYKGNIQADGYREANISGDWMVMEAYTSARYIGQSMPHIDPVKEATAERIKLGSAYDSVPLETGEQACENGNAGDFAEVQRICAKELSNSNTTQIISTYEDIKNEVIKQSINTVE
jgi:capsid protein